LKSEGEYRQRLAVLLGPPVDALVGVDQAAAGRALRGAPRADVVVAAFGRPQFGILEHAREVALLAVPELVALRDVGQLVHGEVRPGVDVQFVGRAVAGDVVQDAPQFRHAQFSQKLGFDVRLSSNSGAVLAVSRPVRRLPA
jgi:hypothetical protein